MEWGPKLSKQKSCTYIAGDVGNWRSSSRRSVKLGQKYVERDEDNLEPLNFPASRQNTPKWLVLWRRLKKGKKRRVSDSSSTPTYDPYTYLQNFDQGSGSLEPDNLSRSFSMRFADSSSLFRRFA